MSIILKQIYSHIPKCNNEFLFKRLEGVNVFIAYLDNDFEVSFNGFDSIFESFRSLPFKKTFFELAIPHQFHFEMEQIKLSTVLMAFSIEEVSPDDYYLTAIGAVEVDADNGFNYPILRVYRDESNVVRVQSIKNNGEKMSLGKAMHFKNCLVAIFSSVSKIIEFLNKNPEYGVTKENFILKKGVGKAAYRVCVNKIIHIRPKKFKEKTEYMGQEIDWSHRWRVRGHWRKVSTVGKNREGEYGIQGFTWVVEHIKGPEELPIIEKTRILHGLSEARA